MFQNKKTLCFIILAIILIVLLYLNSSQLLSIIEGNTTYPEVDGGTDGSNSGSTADERAAYDDNKQITGESAIITSENTLNSLAGDIAECQNMIDGINEMLPRRIEDIIPGVINQTESLNQVKIEIEPSLTDTLDPITNNIKKSAMWKINAILPRGKQGPNGEKGPKGPQGMEGNPGLDGVRGPQGLWGDNPKCENC